MSMLREVGCTAQWPMYYYCDHNDYDDQDAGHQGCGGGYSAETANYIGDSDNH
jgi:hypothetical protein